MKTSKFRYLVSVYEDELCKDCIGRIECITLAEARFEAARHSFAVISCIGRIEYKKGLEVL